MKVVNIMNFVRHIDERCENSTERLLEFTSEQLRLVNFFDDKIEIVSDKLLLYKSSLKAKMSIKDTGLSFEYKGHAYRLDVDGAVFTHHDESIELNSTKDKIILYPKRV